MTDEHQAIMQQIKTRAESNAPNAYGRLQASLDVRYLLDRIEYLENQIAEAALAVEIPTDDP